MYSTCKKISIKYFWVKKVICEMTLKKSFHHHPHLIQSNEETIVRQQIYSAFWNNELNGGNHIA